MSAPNAPGLKMPTPQPMSTPRRRPSVTKVTFPLPDSAFPQMQLANEEVLSYEAQAFELIDKALLEYDKAEAIGSKLYRTPWEECAHDKHVHVTRMKDMTKASRLHYRVYGTIDGDYRHLMDFMYADTTRRMFDWHFMYQTLLDARVLKTFEKGAVDNRYHHYMGIKWMALQSVMRERVHTGFFEYMTYMKDRKMRDIAVRVTIPVEVPALSDVLSFLKVKRFDLTTVQILRPSTSNPAHTYVFQSMQFDSAISATIMSAKKLLEMTINFALYADSAKISRKGMLPQSLWARNSSRQVCSVCTKSFSVARGRHHCRSCGEIICRKCLVTRDAPEFTGQYAFRIEKTKFCVVCLDKLRVIAPRPAVPAREHEEDQPATGTVLMPPEARASETKVPKAEPTVLIAGVDDDARADRDIDVDVDVDDDDDDAPLRRSLWSESETEGSIISDSEDTGRLSYSSASSQGSQQDDEANAAMFTTPMHPTLPDKIDEVPLEEMSLRCRPDILEIIDTKDMERVKQPTHSNAYGNFDYRSAYGNYGTIDDLDDDDDDIPMSFAQTHPPRMQMRPVPTPEQVGKSVAEQAQILRQMVMAVNQQHAQRPGGYY